MAECAEWDDVLALRPLMHDVEAILPHLQSYARDELLAALSAADGNPSKVKIAIAGACHSMDQTDFRNARLGLSFYPFGEVEGVSF